MPALATQYVTKVTSDVTGHGNLHVCPVSPFNTEIIRFDNMIQSLVYRFSMRQKTISKAWPQTAKRLL